MPTRKARAWRRLQENPLISLTLFLAVAGILNLTDYWSTTDNTTKTVLVSMSIGGMIAAGGGLAGRLDAESAGLALLDAGLVFVLLYEFAKSPINAGSVAALLVQAGAFVATVSLRLIVVRKAVKASRKIGQ